MTQRISSTMIESEIFSGFSLRELPGNRRVAVLHLIAADGMPSSEESVFDVAGLDARIRALRSSGGDISISAAALRALQGQAAQDAAAAEAAASAPPAAHALPFLGAVITGLPGRSALLRGLRDALFAAAGGPEHGPQLAILTVRGLDAVAACHGEDAVQAALLGVGDRLDENLRRMDMLAHLGGARFAACLPRVPRRDAEAIAARLARAIAAAPIETPCGPVVLHLGTELFGEAPGVQGTTAERAAAMLAAAEQVEALATA